jgi:hypothetical protein
MTKPIPHDEVITWFNIHNMNYEKIELYGDISKSLTKIISDTYLGENVSETKIFLSNDDNKLHFDWCWNKMVENFVKENTVITSDGEHKNYLKSFYMDIYYNQSNNKVRSSVSVFLSEIFNMSKPFSKSDLEMITEIYKMMDKNVK